MKEKRLMIATCVSSAVAALAIVALVLCLVGVIPVGGDASSGALSEADQWRAAAQTASPNAGMYDFQVYAYLDEFGQFTVDESGADYGVIRYKYSTDDRLTCVTCMSSEQDYAFTDDMDMTSYSYYRTNKSGWADIGDPDANESPDSMERYADFLDWCDEINLTPEQVMEALDWYEADCKEDS